MSLKNKVYSDALFSPFVFTGMLFGLMIVIFITNQAAIHRQNTARAVGLVKIFEDFQNRTQSYAAMIAATATAATPKTTGRLSMPTATDPVTAWTVGMAIFSPLMTRLSR